VTDNRSRRDPRRAFPTWIKALRLALAYGSQTGRKYRVYRTGSGYRIQRTGRPYRGGWTYTEDSRWSGA
jgi:hypothetical protein